AVLHLAEPLTNVEPLPYSLFEPDKVGTSFNVVGYGTRNNEQDSGMRRTGTLTLRGTTGRVFELLFGSFQDFARIAPRILDLPRDLTGLQLAWETELVLDGYEAVTGGGPHDSTSCFGDSGGPLIQLKAGRPTVYGVTSWGYEAADQVCAFGGVDAVLGPAVVAFLQREIACPLLPTAGTCDGNQLLRCVGESGNVSLERIDCGARGGTCVIDAQGGASCG
ncbi:MAG TPA: trypsin-like serine protease, partial [Polyangiaceae bacterium]|nr:trypsin-like serine protease [Polyangiaceae bacterium]